MSRRAPPMPGLVVETVSSIRSLREDGWNALAAGRSFYLSHGWLRAVEREEGFVPRHAVAYRDGRLVGALPAYVWDGRPGRATTYYDPFTLVAGKFVDAAERPSWFPTLLLGSRAGYANELLVSGATGGARTQVVEALLEAALPGAGESDVASAAFLYLLPDAAAELQPRLEPRGVFLLLGAEAVIDVEWDSVAGYLASLKRSRRPKVSREMRRFPLTGIRVEVGRLSTCLAEATPLLAALQQRYGIPDTAEDADARLSAQAAELDDQAVTFEARLGEKLVGFTLFYVWDGAFYGRVAGFDPAFDRAGLYFELGFYSPLRYAIEHGLARLHLGSGSFEAKVGRGARLVPLAGILLPPAGQESRWHDLLRGWNDYQRRWLERLESQQR